MQELKRQLGTTEATFYGVGMILGAGIYTVIGESIGLTGGSVVFSFILAAVIAALTGLSYAELSSMYPKEEGDYLYVRKAFKSKKLSEITALFRILVGIISGATVALAFAGYLSSFIEIPLIPIAIGIVIVTAFINFWGIDFSVKVNILFTAIEVLGLLIIIFIGAESWSSIDPVHLPNGFTGLVGSSFLIFFAYIGFESLVNITEETEKAEEKIPKAIILSIVITTVLYILVAASSVALVDWKILGASDSPLTLVARSGWGPFAASIIGIIALFSTTNTILLILISTSRMLYGVSKKEYKSFPTILSKIHPKRNTPHLSIFTITILTILFTLPGDIGLVAGLTNVFLLAVFALVNASLLKLRFEDLEPGIDRDFTAPINVGKVSLTAVSGLVSSVILILFYIN